MSVEDKIKRAEEIYNRRRENEYKNTTARVNVENKKNNTILRKMKRQIILCLIIYGIFYYILNGDYAFSEDIRNKVHEILSYDISFSNLCTDISEFWNNIKTRYQGKEVDSNSNDSQSEQTKDDDTNIENINTEQNINENNNGNITENSNDQNIGGGTDQISSENETIKNEGQEYLENTEDLTEEEQMKKDAEEIKQAVSFIQPVYGTITSVFGPRNPSVATVSKYHTGLDIGANLGTEIIAATDGKVVMASSEGAYGNHLKVEINGIEIIYAHCSKLCVNEGDEIKQGQKIAEVGSTGNSTGPHLHFEIRKDGRYVNPQLILEFK